MSNKRLAKPLVKEVPKELCAKDNAKGKDCSDDYVSADSDCKKECCDVDKWFRALTKNFYTTLTVSAYAVPGREALLRKNSKNGDWSGQAIELLEKVLARIPGIESYTILGADSAAEAQQLVAQGKAVFDITPTALSSLTSTDFAYLPISDNVVDKYVAIWALNPTTPCDGNTLVTELNSTQSFITGISNYLRVDPNNFIRMFVNSEAQINYIKQNLPGEFTINEQIDNIGFVVVPPQQDTASVVALLTTEDPIYNPYPDVCNSVYFGIYDPINCASTPAELIAGRKTLLDAVLASLEIPLTAEEEVKGSGWSISPSAYHWQIWLQFALDAVIKCDKKPYGNTPDCNIVKPTPSVTDTFVCCYLFSAPPPFYGFCTGFLPVVTVGERLLPTPYCIEPHKISQNGGGCGKINW